VFATIMATFFVVFAIAAFTARGTFKKSVKVHLKEAESASDRQDYNGNSDKGRLEDKAAEQQNAATASMAVALLSLGIAGVIMLFACSAIIEAKQVGVVKTFGDVHEETMSPGWNWKGPFDKVTEIDATTQTDEYKGDSAIQVRLKDGNTAEVYTTIRWSISEEKASQVYSEFRSDDPTDSLRDAMVSTQFKAAANAEFAGFDPLSLAGIDGSTPPDYKALADAVKTRMEQETEGLVNVRSVTVSLIKLDKRSQKHLDDYVAQVAKTRTAIEAKETATKQAEANAELADSISKDPNVLVSRCLDLIESGDLTPPAGFSCWPGGGGDVVIPSGR
jgi:regulator of protease activity HflC (stomatin/prohibitin superfamily)